MNARWAERLEAGVDGGASLFFGGAAAFALYVALTTSVGQPRLIVCAAAAGSLAAVLCSRTLGRLARLRTDFTVPPFELPEFAPFEAGELVLGDSDRVQADELVLGDDQRLDRASAAQEPLVLDDILAELGPDSRVVRLFDRKAMPTPGHLKTRIDDHLGQGRPVSTAPDASQALSDALAELRRSLR